MRNKNLVFRDASITRTRVSGRTASIKQRQQRALAWMLFRVTGMQITGNLRSLKLSHNLLYHINRFHDQRHILEQMIRKELQDL